MKVHFGIWRNVQICCQVVAVTEVNFGYLMYKKRTENKDSKYWFSALIQSGFFWVKGTISFYEAVKFHMISRILPQKWQYFSTHRSDISKNDTTPLKNILKYIVCFNDTLIYNLIISKELSTLICFTVQSGYSLLERMFSVINLENADILHVIHFAQRVIFSRKCGTYFKCKFLCILHRSNTFVNINTGKDILSCGYLQIT